ncbi:uncharacterized protein K460DRAFT_11801 [Cucurbitaria berberidis CBS 394.84]|uniref:Uncharacterized protein n=1 Tax=Cucurbitaria berberidis CBS 394.84 TaxID=1168544 RepID=A0A9P4LDK8_9PLEO|nr:uncharacterized protein K460DRAFT_11801 [Cucurbitaria berberidis CBS 394.84]KAF1850204.1 hypothetical protein K460DRAFT_11801 [Cucurbitaria berberidis CBS 394.84]
MMPQLQWALACGISSQWSTERATPLLGYSDSPQELRWLSREIATVSPLVYRFEVYCASQSLTSQQEAEACVKFQSRHDQVSIKASFSAKHGLERSLLITSIHTLLTISGQASHANLLLNNPSPCFGAGECAP